MEQSYLMELIRTLSQEEKSQVREFASLSFINKGKMRGLVVPLMDICFSFSLAGESQGLDKKKVYKILFPGQNYQEGKLEKLMVEANKVIRSFLITQKYLREDNEFHQILDYSEIIRLRGLHNRYKQVLAKLSKIQESAKWKNSTYYFQQFLLEDALHDEQSFYNRVKGDLNVPNVIQSLEIYFYLHTVTRLNTFLLQQKATKLDIPERLKSVIETLILPQRYIEESPALKINLEIFYLLQKTHPEPSDFRFLFNLLLKYEEELDSVDLRAFYSYLRNICVLVGNAYYDNEEIRIILYELYKDNLTRGYLHYEGRLHHSTFLAVTQTAVRVKQYDWLHEFIENHKHEIIGDNETQDYYRFNKALYLFGIGQFSECLDFIPPSSPSVDYMLHGKRLELKALYELRSDLLSYRLDAFKMFLSRTSPKILSDAQRKTHIEFANLLTQILGSTPGDSKRAERIIHRIEEKTQTADWRWLLEKSRELKQSYAHHPLT